MKRISAILALTLLAGLAQANDCSPIDLRENLQPEMQAFFAEPRAQSDLGWCFAYVAADMLSFRYQKPISAFHMGLIYNDSLTSFGLWGRKMMGFNATAGFNDGGYPVSAIKTARKYGSVCLESDLNSKNGEYTDATKNLKILEKKIAGRELDEMEGVYYRIFLGELFPHLTFEQVQSYVLKNPGGTPAKSLLMLAGQTCSAGGQKIHAGLQFIHHDTLSTDSLSRVIDNVLRSGRPMAMDYNIGPFVRPEDRPKGIRSMLERHVSLIIGRKRVNGQCTYTVRNSWGQTCEHYRDGIQCDKESGTFQLPANELKGNVKAIEYIKN